MKDNNDYLTQPTNQNLGHIAGKDGWPLFGKALSFYQDPHAICEQYYRRYGAVSRICLLYTSDAADE